MGTLTQVVAAIQDVAGALSGMKAAPDDPPESMNQFPFSVCYPLRGTWDGQSAGWMKGLHTVVVEFHFGRAILPKAVSLAIPYAQTFANEIYSDPTLAGTVDTVGPMRYEFGTLRWGDEAEAHIGYRFEIDVKVEPTIT